MPSWLTCCVSFLFYFQTKPTEKLVHNVAPDVNVPQGCVSLVIQQFASFFCFVFVLTFSKVELLCVSTRCSDLARHTHVRVFIPSDLFITSVASQMKFC